LSRRGLGRRRIRERLAAKGVAAEDIAGALAELAADPAESELAAAVRLARRKRLGPFRGGAERRERRDKDLAALGRAGFGYEIARRVVEAESVEALEALLREDAQVP
jgi:regulatory protein